MTVCTAAVSSYTGLIICRIFLGLAESGFLYVFFVENDAKRSTDASLFVFDSPGIIYYLCFWYKSDERATRMAIFSASVAVSG